MWVVYLLHLQVRATGAERWYVGCTWTRTREADGGTLKERARKALLRRADEHTGFLGGLCGHSGAAWAVGCDLVGCKVLDVPAGKKAKARAAPAWRPSTGLAFSCSSSTLRASTPRRVPWSKSLRTRSNGFAGSSGRPRAGRATAHVRSRTRSSQRSKTSGARLTTTGRSWSAFHSRSATAAERASAAGAAGTRCGAAHRSRSCPTNSRRQKGHGAASPAP